MGWLGGEADGWLISMNQEVVPDGEWLVDISDTTRKSGDVTRYSDAIHGG